MSLSALDEGVAGGADLLDGTRAAIEPDASNQRGVQSAGLQDHRVGSRGSPRPLRAPPPAVGGLWTPPMNAETMMGRVRLYHGRIPTVE